jgi:nicotinate-nucleotide adenylyltransferase
VGERIGVLGGTFDPPHVGHVALAEAARDQLGLDRVLLVVAADPWQKRGDVEAGVDDRVAMVEAAVEGHSGLVASDVEVRRGGPSYTADTLEALARPGRALYLVIGGDVAASLGTWERPDDVRALAVLAVAARPDVAGSTGVVEALRAGGWRCEEVHLEPVAASSTEARRRLLAGEPVAQILAPAVIRVIEERGLYTRPR